MISNRLSHIAPQMLKTTLVLLLVIAGSLAQNVDIIVSLTFSQSGSADSLFNLPKPRPGFAVLDNTAYIPFNSLSTVSLPGGDVGFAADFIGTPKGGSCAVFDNEGALYIIGGDTGDGMGSRQNLIYYPGAASYDNLASMTIPRQHHRCAYDNSTRRIYVVGGEYTNGTILTSAEYFSLDGGGWTTIADYPYERAGFGFVSTNDGFLYAFGGRTPTATPTQELIQYVIANNSWAFASTAIINEVADFGYWYDNEVKMIGIFGGPQNSCQIVDMRNASAIQPWSLSCAGLPATSYALATFVGPSLFVIDSDGPIFMSSCALFTKCSYGCDDVSGTCLAPPTAAPPTVPTQLPPSPQAPVTPPVSSAPFSGCSQCSGDTSICIAERGVCVGNRVVPILQCIDTLDSGAKVAYFSYNRVGATVPPVLTITAGSAANLVTPSGTPNSDFTPGRSIFYPLASFTAQYDPNTNVEWFVDGYALDFSSSRADLACPKNITLAVRVSNVTVNIQQFIDRLRQVLADTMGVDIDQITVFLPNKKRDSDLEQELSVVVSPSSQPTDPSPAETVTNFIKNETSVQQIQTQIPEVQEVIGKPLPTELSGQIVQSTSPVPTPTSVVPKAVSGSDLTIEISIIFIVVSTILCTLIS